MSRFKDAVDIKSYPLNEVLSAVVDAHGVVDALSILRSMALPERDSADPARSCPGSVVSEAITIARATGQTQQNFINQRLRAVIEKVNDTWTLEEIRGGVRFSLQSILNDCPSISPEPISDLTQEEEAQFKNGSLWISCGHCGESDSDFVVRSSLESVLSDYPAVVGERFAVGCLACGATGPTADTKREALALWNERADPFVPEDADDRIADIRSGGFGHQTAE